MIGLCRMVELLQGSGENSQTTNSLTSLINGGTSKKVQSNLLMQCSAPSDIVRESAITLSHGSEHHTMLGSTRMALHGCAGLLHLTCF